MAYISEMVGRPVTDIDGEIIGTIEDIIASRQGGMPHPMIVAIAVKRKEKAILIPFRNLVVLLAPAIPLDSKLEFIEEYQPADTDLFLMRDVLDKQIIDTDGVRVVRVNDLEIARVNGNFFISNVDVSGMGLLRRLGLARFTQKVAGRFNRRLKDNVISWDDVELLSRDESMRLKVPAAKMAELHPADIAEIISDLSRSQGDDLLGTLDIETLADTLEEVEPDFQASLVRGMSDERVADVLEEMAPDEAADLLAELPKDRSEDLLELMEDEDADDVRRLLAYPEESAGGIMTTEYIAIPPDIAAQDAIGLLRRAAHEAETIFYVYVTDQENHLIGVFSLVDLIMANPETPVEEFMHKRVVSVNLEDSQDDVAQAIAKYDLLAIPVVDDEEKMMGIVTSDDALDKIIPTAWKKRLPRYYR